MSVPVPGPLPHRSSCQQGNSAKKRNLHALSRVSGSITLFRWRGKPLPAGCTSRRDSKIFGQGRKAQHRAGKLPIYPNDTLISNDPGVVSKVRSQTASRPPLNFTSNYGQDNSPASATFCGCKALKAHK